jgi:ABC-2 type transport system permease protein
MTDVIEVERLEKSFGRTRALDVLGQLGPVLHLAAWLTDLSPFSHVPRLPGGEWDWGPLWMAAVAAALACAGLAGFRRRDLM